MKKKETISKEEMIGIQKGLKNKEGKVESIEQVAKELGITLRANIYD